MKEIEVILLYGLNIKIRDLAYNKPCIFKKILLSLMEELQLPIVDKTNDNCKRVAIENSILTHYCSTKEFIWFTGIVYDVFTKLYTNSGELIITKIDVYKNYTLIRLKE